MTFVYGYFSMSCIFNSHPQKPGIYTNLVIQFLFAEMKNNGDSP